jgi:ADP-ribose pyrophosphatase YjhB (NUDIX family)
MNLTSLLHAHQPANAEERFCSRCGTELGLREEGGRWRKACAQCGHIVFGRFSVGVGGLLFHQGNVLVVQRGHDPGKGRWTLPGGFAEEDESPDDAIRREVREETGLETAPTGILAIRHAQGEHDQNLYMVFGLRLKGDIAHLKADGHETTQAVLADPDRLDELGSFGMISKWIIERFQPEDGLLSLVEPAQHPAAVPSQQWTALFAIKKTLHAQP